MKAAKKQFPAQYQKCCYIRSNISGLKRNHIISESMLGLGMVADSQI
jgi:hypothetical protein